MGKDQTVPYGTDSLLDVFQALNCLATIISSLLRDKDSKASVHEFDARSLQTEPPFRGRGRERISTNRIRYPLLVVDHNLSEELARLVIAEGINGFIEGKHPVNNGP